MSNKLLLYNARVHTQAAGLVVDSIAINRNRIVAVGNNLKHDPDLAGYHHIDLKGWMVSPGFVDAHTHFLYFALSLGWVNLDGLDSIDKCLHRIKKHAASLGKDEWVLGGGYAPDQFLKRIEPDCLQLDKVTDGRPAFIYSKDCHTAWANSRALKMAGINSTTRNPSGGRIEHFYDGQPNGILRENPSHDMVRCHISLPTKRVIDRKYRRALQIAYRLGVTGVHSFDSSDAFEHLVRLAEAGKLGLRINHYPPANKLSELADAGIRYGAGDDFFRIAGVKIFSDGSLGSQSALCFNKYLGSKDNCGLQVQSVAEMKRMVAKAARLGLPAAVHAIGDKAVANVLDAFEAAPRLSGGARHRIEHLQLVRRKDLARLKRLGIVASMQPSHCPSDIPMMRRYWGNRSRNAFVFRTLLDKRIDLAFGSDVPIEPLNPIAGIEAAVRRARPGSHDIFHPEQRITAAEALFGFTAGAAIACGQAHCQGFLLPGYPADLTILSDDVTTVPATRISQIEVLATVLDGKFRYCHPSFQL